MSNERAQHDDRQPAEPEVEDLTPKPLDASDAKDVKGGLGETESISLNYTKIEFKK